MPASTTDTTRTNLLWRGLARVDAWMNRLYTWRYNPLYQSGALAVVLLAVVLLTGLYLLLFYRVGAPYESVARITSQAWAGRWIRGLHRYASDAAVLAVAIHAFRMFAQRRSWGARALAWISGLVLLFIIFACGWTGYVMIWDVQGQVLAVEGARLLDALPLFSEPISRAFVGERAIPSAFFFLNLFLHVALPIGAGLLLWIHTSRVARPVLLPPRRLMWGTIGLLVVLSVLWPVSMAPRADVFRLPGPAPYDLFYSFWLPLSRGLSPGAAWAGFAAFALGLILIPIWTRPKTEERPGASSVDERYCTGCEQCYLDCPYEAIEMIATPEGRLELVARVDPSLCVSCGICSGSCAPMGVGPPERTGRHQLTAVQEFAAAHTPAARDVVLVACAHSTRPDLVDGANGSASRVLIYPSECAGAVHSSVVEFLLKEGAGGVMVTACPPRDCWHREGPRWAEERLYHDREAELQERVDRRRVRLVYTTLAQDRELAREIAAFQSRVIRLAEGATPEDLDLIRMCEAAEERAS